MKQTIKILMVFAVLLVFAFQALAGIGIDSVTVIPSQPSDIDLITFNIAGGASYSPSWVTYDLFSQNGTSLQLDLYVNYGFFTSPSTWDYSKQIQPLVPATYSLEVRAFDNQVGSPFYGTLRDTYNIDFTVTPEPATICLLGLGVLLVRKRLVR